MNMKRTWLVAALLLLAPPGVQAAAEHEGCSIRNVVGDWGFGSDGKSLIASAVPDPATFHMPGLVLPGAFVGRITVHHDGTLEGYFWFNTAGGLVSGLTPAPFTGNVTVNPDCTGEWSLVIPNPTGPPTTLVEKIAIVDAGQEIRTISWETEIPTFTWTAVARRIPGRCTTELAQGAYTMHCRGHAAVPGLPEPFPNPALLSEAGLFRLTVEKDGDVAGHVLEKIGPANQELDFTGSFRVAGDCSAVAEMVIPGLGTIKGVGIMVDATKRGYGLPMIIEPPPEGSSPRLDGISPLQAAYCELVRMHSWRLIALPWTSE